MISSTSSASSSSDEFPSHDAARSATATTEPRVEVCAEHQQEGRRKRERRGFASSESLGRMGRKVHLTKNPNKKRGI